jgi:phosphoglycolate phosphatase-like HAD superfamily hydrolase
MSSPLQLFIDFDGVICDSAAECLFSSWVAYDRLTRDSEDGSQPPSAPLSVPVALRARFLHLRPFIRAGDDYVLIQRLLAGNRTPSRQEEFDHARREAGPQTLARYGDVLNRVRQELMAHDREHWLRLNPLYPGMAELLRAADWATTWILSTKRPLYIQAILAFHELPVPPRAILHAAAVSKLATVAAVLDERQAERAALVDDQLDHLVGNDDPRIKVYLAAWGYAKPEWLKDPRVPALDLPDLRGLVARTMTGGTS